MEPKELDETEEETHAGIDMVNDLESKLKAKNKLLKYYTEWEFHIPQQEGGRYFPEINEAINERNKARELLAKYKPEKL